LNLLVSLSLDSKDSLLTSRKSYVTHKSPNNNIYAVINATNESDRFIMLLDGIINPVKRSIPEGGQAQKVPLGREFQRGNTKEFLLSFDTSRIARWYRLPLSFLRFSAV